MDYKEIASSLLERVGGKSNVRANATCLTRLRITVIDETKVNYLEIKHLHGVLGVVVGTTVQIIFGPGKVTRVGEEFAKLTELHLGTDEVEVRSMASDQKNFIEIQADITSS